MSGRRRHDSPSRATDPAPTRGADVIRDMRKELERSQASVRELQSELHRERAGHADVQAKLVEAYSQLRGLSTEHDSSVSVAMEASTRLKQAAETCHTLRKERDALKLQVAELEIRVEETERRRAADKAKLEASMTSITGDMQELVTLMESEREAHQAEMAKLREAHNAEVGNVQSKTAEVAARAAREQVVVKDLASAKARIRELEGQVELEAKAYQDEVASHTRDMLALTGKSGATGSLGLADVNARLAEHIKSLQLEVAAVESRWSSKFQAAGAEWTERLEQTATASRTKLAAVKANYEEQLKEQHSMWEDRVNTAVADWSKRDKEKDVEWQKAVDKVKADAEDHVSSIDARLKPEMEAIRTQHKEQFEAVLKEYHTKIGLVQEDHKRKIQQCVTEHDELVAALKLQNEKQVCELQSQVETMRRESEAAKDMRRSVELKNAEADSRLAAIEKTEAAFKADRDKKVAAARRDVAAMKDVLQAMADSSSKLKAEANEVVKAASKQCVELAAAKDNAVLEAASKEARLKTMVAELQAKVKEEVGRCRAEATGHEQYSRKAHTLEQQLSKVSAERDSLSQQLQENRAMIVEMMGRQSPKPRSRRSSSPLSLSSPKSAGASPKWGSPHGREEDDTLSPLPGDSFRRHFQ